jgi:hypothetical protein
MLNKFSERLILVHKLAKKVLSWFLVFLDRLIKLKKNLFRLKQRCILPMERVHDTSYPKSTTYIEIWFSFLNSEKKMCLPFFYLLLFFITKLCKTLLIS